MISGRQKNEYKVLSKWTEYRRDQERRKALSGPCVTVYKKPEKKLDAG
jgi:hypothetical protein